MLVELKNGETLNGHLVTCDTWMNLTLKEVVQTSPVRPTSSIYQDSENCFFVSHNERKIAARLIIQYAYNAV
jgi:small nuclear ribonucleoprotein (snRNP)-like protein